MRMSMIAASVLALIAADGASAQRMVMRGPGVSTTSVNSGMSNGGGFGGGFAGRGPGAGFGRPAPAPTARWGSRVGGHWWAGMNAPGGWNAYRRPHRGWNLPSYWVSPSFAIGDWSAYGLGSPPAGYGWTRYYDDAVLIDGNGRVYDDVTGVDWNRGGYAYDDGAGNDGQYAGSQGYATSTYATSDDAAPGYVQPTYGQSTYPPSPYAATAGYPQTPAYAPGAGYPPPPPPAYAERRSSGVGGALVGAALGAGAGYAIGGRGNRVAGSLIGAGVGGVAGYAIDRSSSHRAPVAPGYGAGYGYAPQPGYPGAGYAPPPPPGPAGVWHSPDGGTTVTTTSAGGYYGGSTTVVTVQTAPVVTTTTTEIVEDHVTYSRHRRAPVRHKWVRRTACGC